MEVLKHFVEECVGSIQYGGIKTFLLNIALIVYNWGVLGHFGVLGYFG